MKYKKIQLKNGLNVLFIESHKSPVISVQMWVRTGSADEAKQELGISHFIEHLVFKGTPSFGVGEIAKLVEGSGGELNAYTSFDQTVYYVTMPSNETTTALKVIREMTSAPNFDPSEVDNERGVVIEEIKRGLDSPGRVASQLLFSTVYKKHPYGIPVIGYEKIIKTVSIKTLKSYFHGRYHPKNMFLVVAGDLNPRDFLKEVKTFDRPLAHKFRSVKRTKEPAQSKLRVKIQKSTFQDNFFHLGFRIPNAKHKDIPALEALSIILGSGDSSRLVHQLRIEKHLATSISASVFTPQDDGLFLISGVYKQENFQAIMDIIFRSLQEIRSSHVLAEELAKVKTNIESEQYFSLETVDGLSRSLGSWEFLFKDPSHFEEYLSKVQSLTTADLLKVARKWLTTDNLTFVALTQDPTTTQKLFNSAYKNFARTIKNAVPISRIKNPQPARSTPQGIKRIQLKPDTPRTEQIILDSGAKVLLRPISETPLISVKAAFAGGLRVESPNQRSVAELVSRTWIGNLPPLREAEIYHFFDSRAAAIGSFSGRNSLGLSADFLKPFERDCGNLWANLLIHPSFEDSLLVREKSVLSHQISSRNDKGAQRAILKLQEILFQGHPYQYDLLGTEESVAKVQSQDLYDYWQKIAHPENLVISISGNLHQTYWKELLQNTTKNLKSGAKLSKLFPVRYPVEAITHHQTLNREQTHIAIGFPGFSLKDPHRYVLHIIDSLLSGQGGRLFIELRDKKSLAYSVGPIHMEGIETGYFGAYIGCSPEKADTAIDMLLAEFHRLTTEPVGLEELQKARRYIIGRHYIDMQKTNHVNSLILFDALYDMDINEAFEIEKRYNTIQPEDIQRVAKELFSQPPVICTVGPNPSAN